MRENPNSKRRSGMQRQGIVISVCIAPDSIPTPVQVVEEVKAVAGRGLRGDRYYKSEGTFNEMEDLEPASDITLIESEALEACERDHDIEISVEDTRRNILTQDVPLNHLVGEEFTVGGAVCRGLELCEPCSEMEQFAGETGVTNALIHRGGLNAEIIETGWIRPGDNIQW